MLADQEEPLDSRILRLAREGDRKEACRLLVEAYGSEILGTCISRMSARAGGEDAAQDVLARALVALPNYRGSGGLRPWLHRIAANRCIDLLRSNRSRRIRTVETLEVEGVAAPAQVMPSDVRESIHAHQRQVAEVRRALSRVKEPDRTWVELHYTHDTSYDEIASEAGISRAAVKQRIWRAVKKVRNTLRLWDGRTV